MIHQHALQQWLWLQTRFRPRDAGRFDFVSGHYTNQSITSIQVLIPVSLATYRNTRTSFRRGDQTFLDVQTVISIPEVADYQVRIREKKQKERESRQGSRDFMKYDVEIAGEHFPAQNKRWMMFRLVGGALANSVTPQQLMQAIPWRKKGLFEVLEGKLTAEQA